MLQSGMGTGGNPFAPSDGSARQDGVRAEIYAFGLRNPWRFSFDDGTGGVLVDYPLRISAGLQQQSFFSFTGQQVNTSTFRPVIRISLF